MVAAGLLPGTRADVQSEGKALEKEFIDPSSMGFTNTVGITSGGAKMVYVSGQVGFENGNVPDDIGEQAEIAFKNVVAQLEAAGAAVADVIKINVYIKELDGAKSKAVGAAKAKYFTQENQPASTWVGVTSLIFPNLLIEVEAIAVIDAD